MEIELLYGRRELVPAATALPAPAGVEVLPTMAIEGQQVRCLRCNQRFARAAVALPNAQYYCPACLNLGRVATLNKFYHVKEEITVNKNVE